MWSDFTDRNECGDRLPTFTKTCKSWVVHNVKVGAKLSKLEVGLKFCSGVPQLFGQVRVDILKVGGRSQILQWGSSTFWSGPSWHFKSWRSVSNFAVGPGNLELNVRGPKLSFLNFWEFPEKVKKKVQKTQNFDIPGMTKKVTFSKSWNSQSDFFVVWPKKMHFRFWPPDLIFRNTKKVGSKKLLGSWFLNVAKLTN